VAIARSSSRCPTGRLDGPADRADKLICRHGREIVVAVVGVIGVSLLAKGLSILLGR
jgi:hypothetical protein